MGISTKAIISDIKLSGNQLEKVVREYDSGVADAITKIVAGVDAENITLAVMGKAKRGKSTLVNALLGRTDDVVAPVDRLPASSAVSCFTKASADKATVVFQDGRQEPVPFSRIRDFVTEEGNPENKRGVRYLEIQSAFPSLEEHVVLVDTPGAGSIHEHHDALLYEFIPKADAVLFMITARMPMDQDEIRLLSEIKKADIRRLFFIINRVDESEPQDLVELEEHSRRVLQGLGLDVDRFYRVSAKQAFAGNFANSGVPELLADVQQAIVVARQPIVAQRTASRLVGAVRPIADELEFKLSIAAQSAEDIDRQLNELKNQQKIELPRLQELQGSFLKKWNAAIDEIDKKAGVCRTELVKDALAWVNDASSISLGAFVRDLPGKIHAEWIQRMGPSLETVQSELAGLVAELDAGVVKIEADLKPGQFTVKHTSALATTLDLAEGGAMIAAGAGIGAIPSLVATAATGWLTTVAAWTTLPLWALCGPLGAFVIGAGAFTAFQGWRLSRERMRDRVGPAVRDYMDSLLSNMRDITLPELRAQGELIANTAKEQIASRRARLIKAATEIHAQRPSAEETQELERIRDGLNSVLHDKVLPMTRTAGD
jgi:ribosome biogenesis GTPase A